MDGGNALAGGKRREAGLVVDGGDMLCRDDDMEKEIKFERSKSKRCFVFSSICLSVCLLDTANEPNKDACFFHISNIPMFLFALLTNMYVSSAGAIARRTLCHSSQGSLCRYAKHNDNHPPLLNQGPRFIHRSPVWLTRQLHGEVPRIQILMIQVLLLVQGAETVRKSVLQLFLLHFGNFLP